MAATTRVCDLMDRDLGGWNTSLISTIFSEAEAAVIQNIPISPLLPRDKLIWRCTANGVFSVWSAYHLAVDSQVDENGGASSPRKGEEIWRTCWSLNVPNNVKMFIWRACHNLLPTKLNLFKRRVIDSPLCPICNQVEESVEHIVWLCPSAVDVWGCGSRRIQKSNCSNMSFANLFEELVERYDQ
jgi:hypothetical protein